jgi:Asp-tRNA(Asn)/Glu-tRNA(Gln) amidotransferase C subunit
MSAFSQEFTLDELASVLRLSRRELQNLSVQQYAYLQNIIDNFGISEAVDVSHRVSYLLL